MSSQHKETPPILSLNQATGKYEGLLLIQVDAEIFRRLLLRAIEEDEASDLTDPQTWITAIARVGQITRWLDKPHVTVTPVVKQPAPLQEGPSPSLRPQTKMALLEERLRGQARSTPPYLWETQCMTPLGDHTLPVKERDDISRLRYDERKFLRRLHEEWEQGTFLLDASAAEQERQYQEEQQRQFTTQVEVMASAVNGMRHS